MPIARAVHLLGRATIVADGSADRPEVALVLEAVAQSEATEL